LIDELMETQRTVDRFKISGIVAFGHDPENFRGMNNSRTMDLQPWAHTHFNSAKPL
jgi:hypothetical protein